MKFLLLVSEPLGVVTATGPVPAPPGGTIPSAHDPTARASEGGTDIGNVGRNVLRGPRQSNFDFSVAQGFSLTESKSLEFRADFFNLFNHENCDNPISDINSSELEEL
jgi:hypothetical protein